MGRLRRERLRLADRDGITDTRRERYLHEHWRPFRRRVKQATAVMAALRAGLGLAPLRVVLPDGWGDGAAWSDAVLEDLWGAKGAASGGLRGDPVQQAQAVGWRDQRDHEWHADIDELLGSYGPDPDPFDPDVRASLVEMLLDYRDECASDDRVLMSELMHVATYKARECPSVAPLGDLWSQRQYPHTRATWERMDDGTMRCWVLGDRKDWHVLSQAQGPHVEFAALHGWQVPAFVKRGHGEDWKYLSRIETIRAVLHMLAEGDVPEYRKPKGGRPKVEWLVLDELGRLGVRACAAWAHKFGRDEIIQQLLLDEFLNDVRSLLVSA